MAETALFPATPFALPAPGVAINSWIIAITVTLATLMELRTRRSPT